MVIKRCLAMVVYNPAAAVEEQRAAKSPIAEEAGAVVPYDTAPPAEEETGAVATYDAASATQPDDAQHVPWRKPPPRAPCSTRSHGACTITSSGR
jgi:hypothetical protein